MRKKLRENQEKVDSIGVWVTENYLIIPANGQPLKEPWATISQYIVGWYSYNRLKKAEGGIFRPLHVSILLDCYGYPGTIIFTSNGSPPKGRLIVELQSYSPTIGSITLIGVRVRRFMGMQGVPKSLHESLQNAVKQLLKYWFEKNDTEW